MTVTQRTLRADAQRNLARVLDAARETFAARGSDATVTEIADRAGVGVGTIFRRFPTKEDLLAAVLEQQLDALAVAAEAALEEGGLHAFVESAATAFAQDRCFCEAGRAVFTERPELRRRVRRLTKLVEALVERARAAGEVRDDVVAADIPVLVRAVTQASDGRDARARRRYLAVVLDGLRPRP